jgi:hypothetical protein
MFNDVKCLSIDAIFLLRAICWCALAMVFIVSTRCRGFIFGAVWRGELLEGVAGKIFLPEAVSCPSAFTCF